MRTVEKLRCRLVSKAAIKMVPAPVPAHGRYFDYRGVVIGDAGRHWLMAVYGAVPAAARILGVGMTRREQAR